jgi:hypothetical protein
MGRYQHGHVYEKFGAWHVRYYQTGSRKGKLVRVRLCTQDRKH